MNSGSSFLQKFQTMCIGLEHCTCMYTCMVDLFFLGRYKHSSVCRRNKRNHELFNIPSFFSCSFYNQEAVTRQNASQVKQPRDRHCVYGFVSVIRCCGSFHILSALVCTHASCRDIAVKSQPIRCFFCSNPSLRYSTDKRMKSEARKIIRVVLSGSPM